MSLLGAIASLPQTASNLINSHTRPRVGADAVTSKSGLKAADSTTPPSTTAQATTDIGTTFLSLLTKELQNQDPTAPVDSTAMVGQMISLNQLDQLIAINQALTPVTTPTTPTNPTTPTGGVAGAASGATADSASTLAAKQALLTGTQNPSANTASTAQLFSDATLNAAAQAGSNAAALNLSNFNTMFGGK